LAGPAKRHALAGLARAEAALARDLFRTAAAALERRAAELIAAAKDRDLFGRRRGLTPDERALLRRLRASWRELRAAAVRLERVAPLPAAGSAFAAAVYPMVLVTTRAEPTGREQVATALGAKSTTPLIPQRALAGDGPWILVRDAMRVARHLGARCARVGERWRPQLGVKTGADEVFLRPQPGPATRPAVRGRDLGPWRATPRIHLLWTHAPDGRPLARLPPELAAVLAPHLERLGRRSDCRNGPAWQLFRTALAYAPCRVIWPDLARRLAA